jgi:signal transduction histidine kinase
LGEAISNAVRHGKASHVDITVSARARQIRVKIKDNGTGFPNLHGSYSGEELFARNMGPTSLLARARHMGGTLVLLTSTKGTEIDLEVPV